MLRRILIFALCCSLISCKSFIEKYKRSASGVSELDKKVLYDFREGHAVMCASCKPFALPPSIEGCTKPLASARGSFTYAAETEQASIMQCSGTNKLVVFSDSPDQKLQASSDTPYSDIWGTFDLNQDDKNELLLTGQSTHEGVTTREASLETLEKNTLRAVEDFGIVYTDPCSLFTGANDAKRNELIAKGLAPYVEAVRISYLPHGNHEMPSFTADRLRAACPATPGGQQGPWQVVGN